MGNIGIDVSKEELAKQCREGLKIINDQQEKINSYELLLREIDEWASYMGGFEIQTKIREALGLPTENLIEERDCVVCGRELEVTQAIDKDTGKLVPVPEEVMCGGCAKDIT